MKKHKAESVDEAVKRIKKIFDLLTKEDKKMKRKVSYEDLKEAFMDVVDGESASDLIGMTGWKLKRCERIREIFDLLVEEDKENEKQ